MANNSGLVWKSLKDWFGWRKQGSPHQLYSEGFLYTKPDDLARIMNEAFSKKVKNNVDSLSPQLGCPIEPITELMRNKTCSLELNAVHPDQVDKIITGLKTSSSCGIDNIDVRILKLGRHQLLPVLTHIINLSITTQTFPDPWKIAKVIPLYKKKDETLPESY